MEKAKSRWYGWKCQRDVSGYPVEIPEQPNFGVNAFKNEMEVMNFLRIEAMLITVVLGFINCCFPSSIR